MQLKQLDFSDVPQFSKRDQDYTTNSTIFSDFIEYEFDYSQFKRIIQNRSQFNTNRELLIETVKSQYQGIDSSSITNDLIEQLSNPNCFTITTAHQPSLFTGPLYYCLKILSTIKLAKRLRTDFPDNNIVPIFILGAEDHDFEEINHMYLFGKKIEWINNGNGAVGRFNLEGISDVIEEVFNILGPSSNIADLKTKFETAANNAKDYADFSFRLSHLLFDHLGIVILRMDEAKLKASFSQIIKKEIIESPSQKLIEEAQSLIENIGYSKQAHARNINMFYHCHEGRKRIERSDDVYKVVDTNLVFSEAEILSELDQHPERFSPNVALRPVFQEFILPNLAYIGGGGELAYWTERKSQFAHFGVPFPMLIRRNSALLLKQNQLKQIEKLGFTIEDFFADEITLINRYIDSASSDDYHLNQYADELDGVFKKIEEKIKKIDETLVKTNQSELAKAKKSIQYLESKLAKSIKRKEEVSINRIKKLKEKLFPKGLQERHDNMLEFMSANGLGLLEYLLDEMDPFEKDFKIFILPNQVL